MTRSQRSKRDRRHNGKHKHRLKEKHKERDSDHRKRADAEPAFDSCESSASSSTVSDVLTGPMQECAICLVYLSVCLIKKKKNTHAIPIGGVANELGCYIANGIECLLIGHRTTSLLKKWNPEHICYFWLGK